MTNKSDTIGALAKALAKAQGEIKSAVKDATNPFFKSNYADLPAIVKACKTSLATNDIAYIQTTDFEGQDMWLETVLAHSSGQWISGRYPVRPVKADPQGMGSAITYARRYALAAMVGVVSEEEDDDGNAASGKTIDKIVYDPDPDGQATNWVNLQKKTISAAKALPELIEWLEAKGDGVDRLLRKSPALHRTLMDAYQAKAGSFGNATLP